MPAAEQDADRRETDPLLDEVGREPQREHDRRREDEQDLAFGGRQDVAGDVLDPSVGAELDRAEHRVRDEQHEQQERADREARLDRDDEHEDERDAPREIAPGVRGEERIVREEREDAAELILEEQPDQEAGDERGASRTCRVRSSRYVAARSATGR